ELGHIKFALPASHKVAAKCGIVGNDQYRLHHRKLMRITRHALLFPLARRVCSAAERTWTSTMNEWPFSYAWRKRDIQRWHVEPTEARVCVAARPAAGQSAEVMPRASICDNKPRME